LLKLHNAMADLQVGGGHKGIDRAGRGAARGFEKTGYVADQASVASAGGDDSAPVLAWHDGKVYVGFPGGKADFYSCSCFECSR
jgi:hypothetical protein